MISNESNPFPEPVSSPTDAIQPTVSQTPAVIDPDNPPWATPSWMGVIKAIGTWIGSVACLVFVPLILVIPYFIYLFTSSPGSNDLMGDKTFLFLSILGVIPAHILTFAIAYFVITSGAKHPFLKSLGFEWPKTMSWWSGLAICVVIAGALLGIGALITNFFGGQKTQLDLLIESSNRARIATAFLAVATGPFIEEVIYRGMLYPALARTLNATLAVILVSILFAGVHVLQYFNNFAVIAVITLLSVSLTVVRAVSHSLLPSFVIHLVFNGIQSVLILLHPYLNKAEPVTPPPVPGLELLSLALRQFS